MKTHIVLHYLGLSAIPLAAFDDEEAATLYAGWLDRVKRGPAPGVYRVVTVERNPMTPAMRAGKAHVLAVGAPCPAVVTPAGFFCRCGARHSDECKTETFGVK